MLKRSLGCATSSNLTKLAENNNFNTITQNRDLSDEKKEPLTLENLFQSIIKPEIPTETESLEAVHTKVELSLIEQKIAALKNSTVTIDSLSSQYI